MLIREVVRVTPKLLTVLHFNLLGLSTSFVERQQQQKEKEKVVLKRLAVLNSEVTRLVEGAHGWGVVQPSER